MFPTKPLDPDNRQRVALAKCYALLLRLADEAAAKAKIADTVDLGREQLPTDEQPIFEGVN